jgi:hypothetical protein
VRKIFTTKKRIAIAAVAGAAVLATGGTAFAYFTAGGSGTGSASVGSATNFTITQTGTSDGPLFPGGSENLTFTVTNPSTNTQSEDLSSVSANVPTDSGGNVLTTNNTSAGGCLASWFTATIPSPPSADTSLAPGASVTVTVNLAMTNATSSQDKCQGISGPNVTLTANQGS